MDETTFQPADRIPRADLHAAFVAAFSDYLAGPFQITLDQWDSVLARWAIDLAASRVAMGEGGVLAFAYTSRRPEIGRWRLGAMGARPAARGTGLAPALLDDFMARAQAEGVGTLELECFRENARALRLYRGRGFEVVHALNGWNAPAAGRDAVDSPAAPAAVPPEAAFAWLDEAAQRVADLPLQVTTPSLRAAIRPLTCWQVGTAQLVFSVVGDTPIQVHSLVDRSPAQRDAEALVRALRGTHAGLAVMVPPIQRDDLGGDALRRSGFEPAAMNQVLAVRRAAH